LRNNCILTVMTGRFRAVTGPFSRRKTLADRRYDA
jgi:hypothetical protein